MTTLLKQVKIADINSQFNGQTKDILIENGQIVSIEANIESNLGETITLKDVIVSPGFVDPFVHFCDPGFEQLENISTGSLAALQGGFTHVFTLPNTLPVVDTKTQVSYIQYFNESLPIHISPIGSISKKGEGKDLAEMIDMQSNGAIAFSDGLMPVQSTLLMLKALQYVKAFDGVVIQMPIDKNWGHFGLMNEGILSTKLGLPGIPAIAEELMIARDIELVKYTNSKLHITGVTTAKGIQMIAAAKKEGINLTCSVTPYHLFFNEEALHDYNTLLKVFPPLRTKIDQLALQKAVVEGVVDCISAHHIPQDWDAKTIEFENAKAGIASIETSFAAVKHILPQLSESQLSVLFSSNARNIFKLPMVCIQEGQLADLTFYSTQQITNLNRNESKSKSANSPFWNIPLQGKIIGTYVKGKLNLNK